MGSRPGLTPKKKAQFARNRILRRVTEQEIAELDQQIRVLEAKPKRTAKETQQLLAYVDEREQKMIYLKTKLPVQRKPRK